MWSVVPLFLGHLALGVLGDDGTPSTAAEQMVAAAMQERPAGIPTMENQAEKKMEHDMETATILWLTAWACLTLRIQVYTKS